MEIGSIFEIDISSILLSQMNEIPQLPIQKRNHFIPYYFNTGRTAITALLMKLKSQGYKRVLLPAFLCDSVRDATLRAGLEISYYRVRTNLSIDLSPVSVGEKDIIYVVQYFGEIIDKDTLLQIEQLKRAGNLVIEDISLSLLSEDEACVGFGDYVIGSLRKWFPIVDGGILLSKRPEHFELADAANDYTLYYYTAQILKSIYLNSKIHDLKSKETFLSYNRDGMTSLFSDYTLRKMSKVSIDLLRGIDYEYVRERRNHNYDFLSNLLASIPQIKVLIDRKGSMTPLGMLILSEKRDELFQHLISANIYCNIHWRSNESTKEFGESEFLSSRCITIPCDQRYGKEEMEYIFRVIRNFYGG